MQDIVNTVKLNFSNLHFEEQRHLYTVDGNILPSVSGLIKNYVQPFPADAAKKYAKKNGMTEAQVKAQWKAKSDEACDRGHRVHIFGEYYPYDRTLRPEGDPESIEYKQKIAVMRFWDEMPPHLSPVIMELRMYHKLLRYAGTADILLYNKLTGKLVIADYKTNEDLFKNFKGKTLINGFEDLLDCPFNKYQIQLSLYQILLEQTGLEIEDRILVWLKHEGGHEMWKLTDYTERLRLKMAG